MEIDSNGLIVGTRDKIHNASFYEIALFSTNQEFMHKNLMCCAEKHLMKSILWPIKDLDYFWGNSGSGCEGENTLFKRPTYWIYHKILKPLEKLFKMPLNPQKGANPDQLLPASIYAVLFEDKELILKIYAGLLLRFGFYPNGEHILFKLHHLTPLFRYFGIRFAYTIFDFFFYVNCLLETRKPIKDTTNKIKAFIYLYMASQTGTKTIFTELSQELYFKYAKKNGYLLLRDMFNRVFEIYFGKTSEIYKFFDFELL